MRLMTGLLKPKRGIPGFDVAGKVEAVGSRVTRFRPGDQVFGACQGSCAEYVSTSEATLAGKPDDLTFVEAAALPTSGLAALHALRDVGKVQPGQKVLINGASGGVGTFAVQIAKSLGAEVTGVCSTTNMDMVRSIGADHVIDYTRDDFTRGATRYHLIFDNVENRPLSDCRRVLTSDGTLILNSGTGARGVHMLIRLVKPLILSPFVHQRLRQVSIDAEPRGPRDLEETRRIQASSDRSSTAPIRYTTPLPRCATSTAGTFEARSWSTCGPTSLSHKQPLVWLIG